MKVLSLGMTETRNYTVLECHMFLTLMIHIRNTQMGVTWFIKGLQKFKITILNTPFVIILIHQIFKMVNLNYPLIVTI